MTEIKATHKLSEYVLAYFEGFDWNWLPNQPITCYDDCFECIQFLENKQVKLFIRADVGELSFDDLVDKAKRFLLLMYIQYIKQNGSAPSPFDLDFLEIQISNKRWSNLKEPLYVTDKIIISRFHPDGSPVTKEDFEKEQKEIQQKRIIKLIQEVSSNQIYSNTSTKQEISTKDNLMSIGKVLQIEDRVIRYCMLYDWLCSLLEGQANTSSYIKNSYIYIKLKQENDPNLPTKKKRYNSQKRKKIEEDIFTFCRNSVGHSAANIIDFSEGEVINYINRLTWPLFSILLNKIEEDATKETKETLE